MHASHSYCGAELKYFQQLLYSIPLKLKREIIFKICLIKAEKLVTVRETFISYIDFFIQESILRSSLINVLC